MLPQPPIVDMSALFDPSGAGFERAAASLSPACEDLGVFHVVGHGISHEALEEFGAAVRAFFALPPTAKAALLRTRANAWGYYDRELTKNRPDAKEVFDYGAPRLETDADAAHSDGVNRWPAEAPEIKAPLLAHHAACRRIARALLHGLCASLGVGHDTLDTDFAADTSFVRLNRYLARSDAAGPDAPLFPDEGRLGVHHHSDAGALTVLWQDDVPGLQVLRGDEQCVVDPVPGALTINLGDLLQVCSNDRYTSPVHRVLVDRDRTRLSAPFFYNPSYACTYAPFETLCGETAPRYRPIGWAHFRDQRTAGDYADYGHEIQIADYRVDA